MQEAIPTAMYRWSDRRCLRKVHCSECRRRGPCCSRGRGLGPLQRPYFTTAPLFLRGPLARRARINRVNKLRVMIVSHNTHNSTNERRITFCFEPQDLETSSRSTFVNRLWIILLRQATIHSEILYLITRAEYLYIYVQITFRVTWLKSDCRCRGSLYCSHMRQ